MTLLSPLEQTPLGITRSEVEHLFAPFMRFEDAYWQRKFTHRNRRVWKQYLMRRAFGWQAAKRRLRDAVAREYGDEWLSIDHRSYSLDRSPEARSLWHWDDKRFLASNRGGTRIRQLLLIRCIELLKPRRVLEVGCGNGINLLLLAGRFPEVHFAGVDLTPEGVAAAQSVQKKQEFLPDYLQEFAPAGIADATAFRRIDFRVGDACALPFEPGSFDLVYTSLALEQMERVRERALREIARVAARNVFMIEPFRDANISGPNRRYIVARDYLQARLADLPSYGLKPLWATTDFPQEVFLHACAALTEVA